MTTELPFFLSDDGYTPTAYLAPEFPIKTPMRFDYRFPIPEERDALDNEIAIASRDIDSEDADKLAEVKAVKSCEALMRKIVGWEFVGVPKEKTPVPSIENLRRMPPYHFRRLMNICIYGIEGGDVDPDSKDKTPPKSSNAQLEERQGN